MVKPSCSSDMQKGVWNENEEDKTSSCPSKQHGSGNWTTFSKRSGQRRRGKSNKERWISSQENDPKYKICFTPQEEELVIQLHATIGSRWAIIAQQLPGKTENDVKMVWNSKLRKRLSAMGIDPVTHKPFSQILADYGNIGAFPKARTRFTSLSRDLKNAIVFSNSQPHPIKTHHPLQLYNESANQDNISSINWSDLFLEDAFLQENEGVVTLPSDHSGQDKTSVEDKDMIATCNNFEASSSSNTNSSFVEAMIGSQDEMFSLLPCFYDDPFYY